MRCKCVPVRVDRFKVKCLDRILLRCLWWEALFVVVRNSVSSSWRVKLETDMHIKKWKAIINTHLCFAYLLVVRHEFLSFHYILHPCSTRVSLCYLSVWRCSITYCQCFDWPCIQNHLIISTFLQMPRLTYSSHTDFLIHILYTLLFKSEFKNICNLKKLRRTH